MSQRDYFSLVRKARGQVAIPPRFEKAQRRETLAPAEVEAAFLKANAALPEDGIAVTCEDGRISEVRICLDNELSFRSCPQVDARGCKLRKASMPAAGR